MILMKTTMKVYFKPIILLQLLVFCSISQAANWIPITGTPYYYDSETMSKSEFRPIAWLKRTKTFKIDGISNKTGQFLPKGTPYDELTLVNFGCKGKWFGIWDKVDNVNGETIKDKNFKYGQQLAPPETPEENFVMQVCKAYKKPWEIWK